MAYQLTIHPQPTYLHAIVTGENSLENVAGYLTELLDECKTRKCYRVLIEERLEGPRLRMMDVFEIVSKGSLQARDVMEAVAYVDVNAEGDLMKFAKDMAVGKGLPMRVFSTVEEAQQWL